MTSDRKTHVISRMLSYLLNSDMSDEQLFDVLHNRVGMSKEELNDFSINSLDYLFHMEDPIRQLRDKVKYCFGEYAEKLQRMSPDELISKADQIHSVICSANHMFSAIGEDEARYLLRFKDPLEVVSDAWWCSQYATEIGKEETIESVINNLMDKQDIDDDYELDSDYLASEDEGIGSGMTM